MQDTEYKVFDECGNLIAPSMELGPSARERFEEAGWRFEYDDRFYLKYSLPYRYRTYVIFCKDNRTYYVIYDDDFAYVDPELHKLITYQLEELGWLR